MPPSLWRLACYGCVFLAASVEAAELTHAEIEFVGKSYRYQFDVNIDAPFAATRAVVTDYDNIDQINDGVVDSRILETFADGSLKRKLWLEQCLLIFCFDLFFIETVVENGPNQIVTTIIPEESNFKSGVATWTLTALSETQTRITVRAEQEPDFWIPPVIGPALMKRVFKKEIRETTGKIESAAAKKAVAP
ncbi:MAG: SRPBCC family protein [Gammaproteobacteria bacterium]